MTPEKLQNLVNLSLEGKLSLDESNSLKKTLKSSKDLRQVYYELCQTHAMLEEQNNGFSFVNAPEQTKDKIDFELLDQLLNKNLEGKLNSDELAQLKKILNQSPKARNHYYEFCQTHAILEEQNNGFCFIDAPQQTKDKVDFELLDQLLNKNLEDKLTPDELAQLKKMLAQSPRARNRYYELCQTHAALRQKLTKPQLKLPKKKSRIIPFISVITALAAIFVAMQVFSHKPLIKTKNDLVSLVPFRGSTVATLKKSIGAEFEYGGIKGEPLKSGSSLVLGDYHLEKGVIEVNFPNGARTIIQAPTKFSLISELEMNCKYGIISAFVPPTAKNFSIQTPCAKVIDLGTEFSIWMKQDQFLETHVFKGKVRVTWNNANTAINSKELNANQSMKITYNKNENQEISNIQAAGVDIKNDFFIRNLTEPQSPYSKFIMQHNPVLYLPMEISEDGNSINDWSNYKNDGVTNNAKNEAGIMGHGKFGNALRISGSNRQAYVYVDDYPKASFNQITVSAWVTAKSRPIWASIVKNWGDLYYGQFHLGLDDNGFLDVEINSRDQQSVHVTDNLPMPLERWTHVAFVHTGTEVKLFKNGKIVARAPVNGISVNNRMRSLGIGTKISDSDSGIDVGNPGHWDGRLDEIAIFNKALDDQDIVDMHKTGRPLQRTTQ